MRWRSGPELSLYNRSNSARKCVSNSFDNKWTPQTGHEFDGGVPMLVVTFLIAGFERKRNGWLKNNGKRSFQCIFLYVEKSMCFLLKLKITSFQMILLSSFHEAKTCIKTILRWWPIRLNMVKKRPQQHWIATFFSVCDAIKWECELKEIRLCWVWQCNQYLTHSPPSDSISKGKWLCLFLFFVPHVAWKCVLTTCGVSISAWSENPWLWENDSSIDPNEWEIFMRLASLHHCERYLTQTLLSINICLESNCAVLWEL